MRVSVTVGNFFFRHRDWAFPTLIAGCFAIAIPPSALFGSEAAEHVKDGCAVLIAAAGLALRALVIGYRSIRRSGEKKTIHAAALFTDNMFSLCRNPLYLGNVLILLGIFLMHGSPWTILVGMAIYVAIYSAMIRAEEDYLLRAFGQTYADYCARVPRWLPDPRRWREATRDARFDGRRVLLVEYTNVGITVLSLALAEFYEEFEEPLTRGRNLTLAVLVGIAATAALWIVTVRFLKKRRLIVAG